MSGHMHSGASSHECELVRALEYATPRLLDYSPQGLYRERAPRGTGASTQRDYALCEYDYGDTNRAPSRGGPRLGHASGGGQPLGALAA